MDSAEVCRGLDRRRRDCRRVSPLAIGVATGFALRLTSLLYLMHIADRIAIGQIEHRVAKCRDWEVALSKPAGRGATAWCGERRGRVTVLRQ